MASGLGLGLGPESFALSLLGLCGRGRENENDEESLSKKKKKKKSLLECSLLLGSRRAIYRVHIRMRLALRFLRLLLVVRGRSTAGVWFTNDFVGFVLRINSVSSVCSRDMAHLVTRQGRLQIEHLAYYHFLEFLLGGYTLRHPFLSCLRCSQTLETEILLMML